MKTLDCIKYILVAATIAGASACTDYLDIKPYGKVIPKTADEFSSLLHNHLNDIDYGEEVIAGNVSSIVDYECYADNLESILTAYPQGNYIPLYVGAHLSNKQSYYGNLYSVVRDCNITIGYLEERESRLGKDVLGTAYALRGICYYNLLRNFCEPAGGNTADLSGVPLVTEFDMEARPVRSSFDRTVARIEEDFKAAISYDIEDPVFRFNNDIISGYLARLYFWTGNYSGAASLASGLLQKYPLISGDAYLEMMNTETQKKGNMIFKSGIITDNSHTTADNGAISNTKARPISKEFIDLFTEGEKDIRYSMSIGKKRVFAKNIYSCLRSAELQLIMMESYYHLGRTDEALDCLNELRRNRITDVTDYTSATLPPVNENDIIQEDAKGNSLTPLIYAILCERRKELFMEGDRWFELKRNGRPEMWTAKQGRKYVTYKFMYTFPLPISDVELIDGLVQNPGYDKVQ